MTPQYRDAAPSDVLYGSGAASSTMKDVSPTGRWRFFYLLNDNSWIDFFGSWVPIESSF